MHLAKSYLPSVSAKQKKTQQRTCLPSAKKAIGKQASLPSAIICQVFLRSTRQRACLSSAKSLHLANHLALTKEPVSGS
jgi:hypothetical protein